MVRVGIGLRPRQRRMFLSMAMPCIPQKGIAHLEAELERVYRSGRIYDKHLKLFPNAFHGVKQKIEEGHTHPVIAHFFGAHNEARADQPPILAKWCTAYPAKLVKAKEGFTAVAPDGEKRAITGGRFEKVIKRGQKVFVHQDAVVWLPTPTEFNAAVKAYRATIEKIKLASSKKK